MRAQTLTYILYTRTHTLYIHACMHIYLLTYTYTYTHSHAIIRLEQRKLQLKMAMDERMHEIKIHKEMLMAQAKEAEFRRQQLSKGKPCNLTGSVKVCGDWLLPSCRVLFVHTDFHTSTAPFSICTKIPNSSFVFSPPQPQNCAIGASRLIR